MPVPREINLRTRWVLGAQIGKGGFGRVFEARGADGIRGAAKLIPKAPGADRELLFVRLAGVRNVIPILDSGEIEGEWVIVMPRAEKSLRDLLDSGALENATNILCDIATALSDLDAKVVHRDLKPENVLLLNGKWCLADFGISRYAEATTAPDTQKYALSPPYAAPERWRSERATGAVDVYALGVMAFEIFSGRLPFLGPTIEDFREQHLHRESPELSVDSVSLKSLVAECLYKSPGARPSPANILARIQKTSRPSLVLDRLRDANHAEVSRRSESERLASASRSADEVRRELFKSALHSGELLTNTLFEVIQEAAPAANLERGQRRGATLALGAAQIEFHQIEATTANPWNWQSRPAFDVIAQAGISVRKPRDRYEYEGRSHSLWYCDAQEKGRFRWFEVAFMITPMIPRSTYMKPFFLNPGAEAAKALWAGISEFQLAWPFEPLDVADLNEFVSRWANWFAKASQNKLFPPSMMPERATPRNWRQV